MVRVIEVKSAEDIVTVRRLFTAYAETLPFSLEFQGFAAELADLPAPYAPPGGCLFLAILTGAPAGVVGVKRSAPDIAEIKRLYVDSAARGQGLGRLLAERAIAAALAKGYARIRLDTHRPSMTAAIALYRQLGFHEIPPYGPNPGGEFAFFEKRLRAPGE